MNEHANDQEDFDRSDIAEARMTASLERRPVVTIPADFAARVMKHLPEKRPRSAPLRVGSTAAYFSSAVVALALLVLARTNPQAVTPVNSFAFLFEMLLVAELLAVGYWLGTRRDV